jgi:hypothetical protein
VEIARQFLKLENTPPELVSREFQRPFITIRQHRKGNCGKLRPPRDFKPSRDDREIMS